MLGCISLVKLKYANQIHEIIHFNLKPSTHAYNTWPFPQLPQASLRYKPDNIYSEFDEGGELPHCNFFYQLKCH